MNYFRKYCVLHITVKKIDKMSNVVSVRGKDLRTDCGKAEGRSRVKTNHVKSRANVQQTVSCCMLVLRNVHDASIIRCILF